MFYQYNKERSERKLLAISTAANYTEGVTDWLLLQAAGTFKKRGKK